jgi:protein-tyrosine kinase
VSIIEKAVAKLGEHPPKLMPRPAVVPIASQSAEVAEPAYVEPAPRGPEPAAARTQSAAGVRSDEDARETTLRYEEIDLERLGQAGLVTPGGERSAVFEEFRLIKRPLLRNALNQGAAPIRRGNLIMVTSCMPGEGKSFTSVNLAMSIAMELDHTVLLVDADVAKPSVPGMLGIEGGVGLMDVLLEDKLPLSQVMIRTNVEKLKMLTSGRKHPNATELLASAAMRDLLEEMSLRYSDRIIVFDSPPLLATTEARVLAGQMGQIVVVVEAGKTTQQSLREGLHHLENCEVVSLVLNKARFKAGGGYYGYGYGTHGAYGAYGS